MASSESTVGSGPGALVVQGSSVTRELPSNAKMATDWVQARIVRGTAGRNLSDAHIIQIRSLLKNLARWESLSAKARVTLWEVTRSFLAFELKVSAEELDRPIQSLLPEALEVKRVHELDNEQRARLGIRKTAAQMLAARIPHSVILRELGGRRSRSWLNKLARRIQKGDVDLLDQRTRNSGVKRYGETPRSLLEGLAFDPLRKPPVTQTHKLLRAECVRLGVKTPSLGWVRGQLKRDPQLKLLHDAGSEEFRRQHRPSVLTKDQGVLPGEIYEIDSTQLDIFVRVPQPDGEWEAVRPSLTCVIDVGSRAVVGMHLTLGAPTEVSVAQAFMHAVLPKTDPNWPMHGKPRVLRMDHGPEYGSTFVSAVAACGVTVEWSPPHYPDARGKGERFFGTLNALIHGLPGTTKALGTYDAAVRKALPALYTPDDLLNVIRSWVTLDYHFSLHRGTNALPARLWSLSPGSIPACSEEIAALLPHSRTVSVTHGHVDLQVDAQRYRFMATFLAEYLAQKVTVRWMELDCVHVFDAGTNRYLGMAVTGDHELARQVADEMIESRRQSAAELAAHHKRAKAQYLSDASMTPTVQRQLSERVKERAGAKKRAEKTSPKSSAIDEQMQTLLEERYK